MRRTLRKKKRTSSCEPDAIALDGVDANQLANVILFGETSPDYDVTAVSVSVIYKF